MKRVCERRRAPQKRPSGGQKGNKNAKRPNLVWPEDMTLESKETANKFIRHLVKQAYENRIDARNMGAINNSLRLYYESNGWISKTPLQIIQSQAVLPPRTYTLNEIADALESLPLEAQDKFFRKLRERHVKVGSPASSSGS